MSLIAELKRRNVFRVGIAYVVIAWVIAQVTEFAFENFGAPEWALKAVVVLLLLGLPLALFFAWAFEMTPEGVKLEKDVDRSASITPTTGRKLDRFIIGVLAVALGWFAWDKFSIPEQPVSTLEIVQTAQSGVSVAVLPFLALSNGDDDGYFADGLTEEILNSLAQLPELLVTSRTSAFSFKGKELPANEIAEALGVDHIVEGSVRRANDRLRVTAQLIRADGDVHLWSENYDSTSTDAIAVQEDIAEQIAVALDVVLDDDKRAAMRAVGLRNPAAFSLYQRATELFSQAHGEVEMIEGLKHANVYYDQVIALAPNFVQAYIDRTDLANHMMLGDVLGRLPDDIDDEELMATYEEALESMATAASVAATPDLRALVEFDRAMFSDNWNGVRRRMRAVLSDYGCKDGNSTSWAANVLGFAEENVARARKLLTCDPLRSLSWFNLARAQMWSGDAESALLTAREGLTVAPGRWLELESIRIMLANNEIDEALTVVDTNFQGQSDLGVDLVLRGMIAAKSGDADQFENYLAEYTKRENADTFWLVSMNAWGGKIDEANRLAASMDNHPFSAGSLLNIVQWCACGAPWDISATPNFAAKVAEAGIPWVPMETISFPLKTW